MSTMEWSLIQVPFDGRESYCVADMAELGGLCLVASKEQCVQFWARKEDGWVIMTEVSLLKEFGFLKKLRHDEWMKRVHIPAARDGPVYLEFWSIRKPNSYPLVLNWESMNLAVYRNDSTEPYRGIVRGTGVMLGSGGEPGARSFRLFAFRFMVEVLQARTACMEGSSFVEMHSLPFIIKKEHHLVYIL